MPHICIWITCFLFISYASLRFSFKYLVYNQTQADIFLTDYAELSPQDHQMPCQHGIKCYSQLVDIVNFCGKQHNFSPYKKTHGSDLLSVVK